MANFPPWFFSPRLRRPDLFAEKVHADFFREWEA